MFARPRYAKEHDKRKARAEKEFLERCATLNDPDAHIWDETKKRTKRAHFDKFDSSYNFASNDPVQLESTMCQRGYRVLSYKDNINGNRVVFDILDGSIYNCSYDSKITKNAVMFDSKQNALSERFPSNQFAGSLRSGNGIYPRVLVAFDGWGKCQRRLGGGPSSRYEFLRFVSIVQFLDPVYPLPARELPAYKEPHFFGGQDKRYPNRGVSNRALKLDRSFKPHFSQHYRSKTMTSSTLYEPIL